MSPKADVLDMIKTSGVIAVLRTDDPAHLVEAIKALQRAGIRVIELTMTIDRVLQVLPDAVSLFAAGDGCVGVGTVLDAATARQAIVAGAQFVVSPVFDLETVQLCRRYSVPVIPGVYTPQDVLTAWKHGADILKLFPAGVGGPSLLASIREPFAHIDFVTTNGDVATAADYIRAGASAICFGGSGIAPLIEAGQFDRLEQTGCEWMEVVREAKRAVSDSRRC